MRRIDLERSDSWGYYADRHLARTREFVVSTVLEQVSALRLRERSTVPGFYRQLLKVYSSFPLLSNG